MCTRLIVCFRLSFFLAKSFSTDEIGMLSLELGGIVRGVIRALHAVYAQIITPQLLN